ncbi:protease inhibitor Inh/omp19 family protein [Aquabacter cavernae]|uniref:protease inhibitor Inh/omp19 family protein n=1 Tax=Aquabacter cavernae TaxID=2496029 RepID=UPI000F8EC5DA|nr:protease inhibitor Inh/omp19 family protein [Aquabacter cavernae]
MRFAPVLSALLLGAALTAPALAQTQGKPDAAKPAAPAKPAPQRPAPAKPEPARPLASAPKVDPALLAAAQKVAATFQLASADGARACAVTLTTDPAGSGFAVDFARDACAALPFMAQVASWGPDPSGAIRLTGAEGRTIAEFTEATGGSYEALRDGDGVYFLAPPSALHGIEAAPEEMLGEWQLFRAVGAPVLCRWTLTDTPAGGGRQVQVAPGCSAPLAEFAATAWRLEGGNVVVTSAAGQSPLRFARQEDGTWAKTPERGRPLLLIRP